MDSLIFNKNNFFAASILLPWLPITSIEVSNLVMITMANLTHIKCHFQLFIGVYGFFVDIYRDNIINFVYRMFRGKK